MQQPAGADLRPLEIGEILDRAVVLLLRNWTSYAIGGALAFASILLRYYVAAAVRMRREGYDLERALDLAAAS